MIQNNVLLSVENLEIVDPFDNTLVAGVSFYVEKKEIIALQGESGCGKTLTALALMGLLPLGLRINNGQIVFNYNNILLFDTSSFGKLRGKFISMVFQDPKTSFNPLRTIGKQLEEIIKLHEPILSINERKEKVKSILEMVGLDATGRISKSYIGELSGGQLQRCSIAANLLLNTELLLLDEPTSSLDFEATENIMNMIKDISIKKNIAIIVITHDNKVAEKYADRIIKYRGGKKRLGNGENINVRGREKLENNGKSIWQYNSSSQTHETLIKVNNLTKKYPIKNGISKLFKSEFIYALKEFSLELKKGEILGLTGPSGCGKTTLAKCLVGLQGWDNGTIIVNNTELRSEINPQRSARLGIQMIWQHPFSSLNPVMTIEKIFNETGYKYPREKKKEFNDTIYTTLDLINLPKSVLRKRPNELSGGECQRVAIANILLLNPNILIADEAISFLDIDTKYKIIDLFKKLNRELDLSIIFLSHDKNILDELSDRILFLRNKTQN